MTDFSAAGIGTSPDEIAHVIRNAIANGMYRPGDRLSQVELAARFHVSRIPLREAIRTLLSEGLLTQSAGGRTTVRNLDPARIAEIYQLRQMIEPSFAAEVIRNCSRADIENLELTVQQLEAIGSSDPDEWSRINFAFHLDMYRIASLPIRYEMISQLYYLVEPYSRMYVHNSGGLKRAQAEHWRMIEALRAGDESALASSILDHVNGGLERLVDGAEA